MYLVLGLGNPGARHVGTRHNVGFLVVDALARRYGAGIDKDQLGALTASVRLGSESAVLAKPQGFMNLSGRAGGKLAHFYKVPLDHTVVVHDELELPFGEIRVKVGGGHAGHNGLRDLHKHLGADFVRVRVGISRPPQGWKVANYVLGRWSDAESASLEDMVADAADAVETIVRDGVAAALDRFAGRAARSA